MRLEPAVEEAESGSTMTEVDVPEDTTLRLRVDGLYFMCHIVWIRVSDFGFGV